jgi:hypothetical protein
MVKVKEAEMSGEGLSERNNADNLANIICILFYITVPIIFAYLLTKFGIAKVFGIEGWERSLPFYFYCFCVIFELLSVYIFGKYKVNEKISNFLIKNFQGWL